MPARPLTRLDTSAVALNGEAALRALVAASDLALRIDGDGMILDASPGPGQPRLATAAHWVGRRWVDVVAAESRPKVEALLRDARAGGHGPSRQLNHPHSDGAPVPLLYSAVEVEGGEVVALGRDMTPLAHMQQRLVRAQQALERDYARLLEMERRYRTLFQVTSNGVLVVDAASSEILEANPAAVEMLAPGALRIAGRRFPEGFDRESAQALAGAAASARAQGAVEDVAARLAVGERPCRVSLHLFHEGGAPMLLVRVAAVGGGEADAAPGERARLLADCLQAGPEAFVAAGADGRILHANGAFVALAEAPGEEALRRQLLEEHLGRTGVDLDVLLAALRSGEAIRGFATAVRGAQGRSTEVEVSAVRLPGQAVLGFFVHDVDRRLPAPAGDRAAAPPSEVAGLVGRMPLKAIVGRASDAIEEGCIRRALELTGDNRAAAAELLGLSRQTLYAKLRRLGLDAPDDPEA